MLQVQVHIKLPKPAPGVEYSRKLLDEIAERWFLEQPLPARVKVMAVSWNGGRPVTGKKMELARFQFSIVAKNGPFRFTGEKV